MLRPSSSFRRPASCAVAQYTLPLWRMRRRSRRGPSSTDIVDLEPNVDVAGATRILIVGQGHSFRKTSLAAKCTHHLQVVPSQAFPWDRPVLGEATKDRAVLACLEQFDNLAITHDVFWIGNVFRMKEPRILLHPVKIIEFVR